jgi:hypothetical protein
MANYGTLVKKASDTALDLGVHLPVGAVVTARDVLSPERVFETYRELVDRGRGTIDSLLGKQRQQVERIKVDLAERRRQLQSSFRSQTEEARQRTERGIRGAAARAGAAPSPTQLPIQGYDDLTAQEVTSRLNDLTQDQIVVIEAYERGNQNRATVLAAIEPRLIDLPIVGYDDLTADEIVTKLGELPENDLRIVRDYEHRTRGRKTVLERIESLA